ncbi:recombinase family protein [Kribbella sp. NPDC023972]|uniref:recombinase family protein n=1 Tax=Kribbella sp. NPDC023972 TaxID=3154795 RepID=UPI0033FBF531
MQATSDIDRRLGRNFQDLISIVSGLRQREVGFKSLHEALDTTTPGGRMIFHVFAALGEFIREMIVQGTREGLDAARARGTRLGRPPAMTPEQIQHAGSARQPRQQRVVDRQAARRQPRHHLQVRPPSSALPPYPPARSRSSSPTADEPGTADVLMPMLSPPSASACPTCGHRPSSKHELKLHREGPETVWLLPDQNQPATAVVERWHCERCQPHQARIIMCGLCSSTVMLGDELVAGEQVPDAAALWLATRGWTRRAEHWICGQHG